MTIGLGNWAGPGYPTWPESGGVPYDSGEVIIGTTSYENQSYGTLFGGQIGDIHGSSSSGYAFPGGGNVGGLNIGPLVQWGQGTLANPAYGTSVSFPYSFSTTTGIRVYLSFYQGSVWSQPTIYSSPYCISSVIGPFSLSTTGFTYGVVAVDPGESLVSGGLAWATDPGAPFGWMATGYA